MSRARRPIVIEHVRPAVDDGRYPVKRVVGDALTITADIFKEGHDLLAASIRFRAAGETGWRETPLSPVDNDGWAGSFPLEANTRYRYTVEAWTDTFGSWVEEMRRRLAGGQADLTSELLEGGAMLARARGGARNADADALARALERLGAASSRDRRLDVLLDSDLRQVMARVQPRPDLTRHDRELEVVVDRPQAAFAAWYEMFPRSQSRVPGRHGTFDDCIDRLPGIRRMGFDVVYLPPIHPIGRTARKGPDNALAAGPGDPGSPWAIGGPEGGHTAVHPELGTIEDFRRLVKTAQDLGMEIALDFAIQCSPDHPWVREHPEWFYQRPDGTIKYAENPPKKYQDIYPINFATPAWESLWTALLGVVRFWIDQGVRTFRVDNPHTKPLRFWERLLGEIRGTDPDVLFLAEAFTRPAMMHTLAKIGFHQSYTYFTWRNGAQELEEYMLELSGDAAAYMRPNFFTNTPDILNEYLQHGGVPAFKIRAVLAAMLSPTWGIYSGYELCENVPIRPGSEEYMDSEKYQYRPRDWEAAARDGIGIADYITELNRIRRTHPALHRLRNLRFHAVDQPGLMCFSKRVDTVPGGSRDDTVLVVVNLDPYQTREATVWLDLPALGVDREFIVTDELTGESYRWGHANYVRLNPATRPAHVFSVTPQQ